MSTAMTRKAWLEYLQKAVDEFDWEAAGKEQEPVAWMQDSIELYVKDHPSSTYTIPLYTSPPQRQPLTDEQRREIAHRWRDGNGTASEIIDMVEAAHGIKGEA